MAVGPGKYDDACSAVREQTDAALVAVIVIGGKQGNGFSVQALPQAFPALAALPAMLRQMADEIEGRPQ